MQTPRVTVITATYNAAKTIQSCMKSIRDQDYPSLEHVIIDGGSSDETMNIVRANADSTVHWISEPDRGIYDAWNKGLAMAQGEWISFLGADDRYLPSAVSAYMDLAGKHPDALYMSSKVRLLHSNGRGAVIGLPWEWPRFQRYMCSAHVGSMHHRLLFERYGVYDTSLRMVADYELLLRAGLHLKSAYLPQITAEMQSGGITDSTEALDEAALVKLSTGHRLRLLVGLERSWAKLSLRIKQKWRRIS